MSAAGPPIPPGTPTQPVSTAEIDCPNPECNKKVIVNVPQLTILNHRDFAIAIATHPDDLEQCPHCRVDLLPKLVAVNSIFTWLPGKDQKEKKNLVQVPKGTLIHKA